MSALRSPSAVEYQATLECVEGTPKEMLDQIIAIRMNIHGAFSHGQIDLNEWLALMNSSSQMQTRIGYSL
jgi:hypothetical protein